MVGEVLVAPAGQHEDDAGLRCHPTTVGERAETTPQHAGLRLGRWETSSTVMAPPPRDQRPFPLDAVPRVIEQAEWLEVDAGVRQRVTALEAFLADSRGWIAQPVVQLSTIPTLVDEGVRPRHADLRPFAVNDGREVWVLPGGLTRVALPEGELVVNSSQGGGSKDTWVVGQDPLQVSRHSIQSLVAGQAAATESLSIISPEILKAAHQDHGPHERPLGHGQQEQQQQGRGEAC